MVRLSVCFLPKDIPLLPTPPRSPAPCYSPEVGEQILFLFMEGPTIQNLQFSASRFQCSVMYRPQYLIPPGCVDPSPGLNDEKKTVVKMDGSSRLGKQQA